MSLAGIHAEQEFHAHPHAPQAAAVQEESTSDAQTPSLQHPITSSRASSRRLRRRTKIIKRTTKLSPQYSRPGRKKHEYLSELFYGVSLYLTCIYLPSFPYYIYQIYKYTSKWSCYIRERLLWTLWITWRLSLIVLEKLGWVDDPFKTYSPNQEEHLNDNVEEQYDGDVFHASSASGIRRFGRKFRNYIFSTSTASLWEEFNQQHTDNSNDPITSPSPSPYTWGYGRTTTYFPAILMVLQDIQLLLMLAILLAVIRIWFVHMLVPDVLAQPRRLEALTRCKSSHLLSSSSYSFGGVKGWDEASKRAGVRRTLSGRFSVGSGSRSNLLHVEEENRGDTTEKKTGYYERVLMWFSYHWYRLRPSVRRALGHEPSARYDAIVALSPPKQQQTLPSASPFRRSNSITNPTQQLFSAPRYATATFRLLYTSISTLVALLFFQSAEFWPRWVFGTHEDANTHHCWDLSGSFSALGFLDDDYDAKNGALKYFFLTQAAYQLHSLCFHIVSMLLLMLYGGSSSSSGNGMSRTNSFIGKLNPFQHHKKQVQSTRLVSMKTSMQSYLRPMVEHCIVLCCLVGAYLFSGLRRLCAVGIFTLELSSVSLQLLQVCIYAPQNSWWRKPEVVVFVHRVLTVPMFVYCRLIVLPFILWRSALFESQPWLEQVEKVFSPGWGEKIYALFNGSLCLIFALNLVLFRRLLFHPHLKQIMKQKKERRQSY